MTADRQDWVAIACDLKSNPKLWRLTDALEGMAGTSDTRHVVAACLVFLLGAIKLNRPDGNVKDVTDAQLEYWADWPGAANLFAEKFRDLFVRHDGVVAGWEERNGRYIRALEKRREQQRKRLARWRKEHGHEPKPKSGRRLRNSDGNALRNASETPPKRAANGAETHTKRPRNARLGHATVPNPTQPNPTERPLGNGRLGLGLGVAVEQGPVRDNAAALEAAPRVASDPVAQKRKADPDWWRRMCREAMSAGAPDVSTYAAAHLEDRATDRPAPEVAA